MATAIRHAFLEPILAEAEALYRSYRSQHGTAFTAEGGGDELPYSDAHTKTRAIQWKRPTARQHRILPAVACFFFLRYAAVRKITGGRRGVWEAEPSRACPVVVVSISNKCFPVLPGIL